MMRSSEIPTKATSYTLWPHRTVRLSMWGLPLAADECLQTSSVLPASHRKLGAFERAPGPLPVLIRAVLELDAFGAVSKADDLCAAAQVMEAHREGRPVLIGTGDVAESEAVSRHLDGWCATGFTVVLARSLHYERS